MAQFYLVQSCFWYCSWKLAWIFPAFSSIGVPCSKTFIEVQKLSQPYCCVVRLRNIALHCWVISTLLSCSPSCSNFHLMAWDGKMYMGGPSIRQGDADCKGSKRVVDSACLLPCVCHRLLPACCGCSPQWPAVCHIKVNGKGIAHLLTLLLVQFPQTWKCSSSSLVYMGHINEGVPLFAQLL